MAERTPPAPRDPSAGTAGIPLTEPLRRATSADAQASRRGRFGRQARRTPPAPGPTTAGRARPTGSGRGSTGPGRVGGDRSSPTGTGRKAARADTDRKAPTGTDRTGRSDTGSAARGARRAATGNDPARSGSSKRPSALRDVTRPIARDSRMTQRQPLRIGYGLIAGAIGLALVAALVVLPIRRWWDQRADLADRKNELAILERANDQLTREVTALNTPEGIEVAARDELDYGYPGEERTRSVGAMDAPIALPSGYPYSIVTGILTARANLAVAPPATEPGATDAAASDATAAPAATEAPEPTIAAPPDNAIAPAGP